MKINIRYLKYRNKLMVYNKVICFDGFDSDTK